MNKKEAISDYRKLMYELAKVVDKLGYIKERTEFINQRMNWDGMFEMNLEQALENLAQVESAMITYSLEDEYREDDIKEYRSTIEALENNCREEDSDAQ